MPEDSTDPARQRAAVRDRYADIATDSGTCCSTSDTTPCCAPSDLADGNHATSRSSGYPADESDAVAPGADLGLGCGNPSAIAELTAGETVLDLGSGAGFDCFLAARKVGPTGRVIGVDMTPEMVERARSNIETNAASNVEFRLGEIEHLPVADETVDVIISNCVINLSPDKRRVFDEAKRVLRPGGRLAISDVVRTTEPPADLAADPTSVAACVGGAALVPELRAMLTDAGFIEVAIEFTAAGRETVRDWDDERDLSRYFAAATIEGRKPA